MNEHKEDNTMKNNNNSDDQAPQFENVLDDPNLTAYALGELTAADGADVAEMIAAFEKQIETNPAVRAFVEEVRATAAALTSELQGEAVAAGEAVLSSADEARMADFAVAAAGGGAEADAGDNGPLPFPSALVQARWFRLSAGLAAVAIVAVSASLVWQAKFGGSDTGVSGRFASSSSEVGTDLDGVAEGYLETIQGGVPPASVSRERARGGLGNEAQPMVAKAETTLEHSSKKIESDAAGNVLARLSRPGAAGLDSAEATEESTSMAGLSPAEAADVSELLFGSEGSEFLGQALIVAPGEPDSDEELFAYALQMDDVDEAPVLPADVIEFPDWEEITALRGDENKPANRPPARSDSARGRMSKGGGEARETTSSGGDAVPLPAAADLTTLRMRFETDEDAGGGGEVTQTPTATEFFGLSKRGQRIDDGQVVSPEDRTKYAFGFDAAISSDLGEFGEIDFVDGEDTPALSKLPSGNWYFSYAHKQGEVTAEDTLVLGDIPLVGEAFQGEAPVLSKIPVARRFFSDALQQGDVTAEDVALLQAAMREAIEMGDGGAFSFSVDLPFEDARNEISAARVVLEKNKDQVSPEVYGQLRDALTTREAALDAAKQQAVLAEAAAEANELRAVRREQRMQLELDRNKKITEKLISVRRLQIAQNYEEALLEVRALRFLDPGIAVAQALDDILVHQIAASDSGVEDLAKIEQRISDQLDALTKELMLKKEREDDAALRSRIERQIDQQIANEDYARITDNPFKSVSDEPLSTFSVDVDTASYANVRRFLNQNSILPPADAVRIEEMINNFDYGYEPPSKDAEHPFAVETEVSECPWNSAHRLAKIGLKGYEIARDDRPATNLVFLIDSSGSMRSQNKLPLVQRALVEMIENLTVDDRIAIVTYAGSSRLVLDSTPVHEKQKIIDAINSLGAGGSTNGEGGIIQAYDVATEYFIDEGVNRVILCTDGDFNVGTSDDNGLLSLIEVKRETGVYLSVLGFGMGNIKDAKLEMLADKGNGNYAYIDNYDEARKVLVDRMAGMLVTIAKDVKFQIDFNPVAVSSYRLIGYENRVMAARDFNDDTKDAGEIGAGHTVTALYEIVPTGTELIPLDDVDDSVFVETKVTARAEQSGELFNIRLRYKQPNASESTLWTIPVTDAGTGLSAASDDFHFAASVASFGMILRQSPYRGSMTYEHLLDLAIGGSGEVADDARGDRAEFVGLIRRARGIAPFIFEPVEVSAPNPEQAEDSGVWLDPSPQRQGWPDAPGLGGTPGLVTVPGEPVVVYTPTEEGGAKGQKTLYSEDEALASAVEYYREKIQWEGDLSAKSSVDEDGNFVILITRHPAVPGGHYTIVMAPDGTVVDEIPGS